jgi:hypothetical protein
MYSQLEEPRLDRSPWGKERRGVELGEWDGWIYSVLYLAALLTIKGGPGFYFLVACCFISTSR